jgi:hypothetical protein
LFRPIGSRKMKNAPRNDPRMLPSPPTITMNRTMNDRKMSKADASTVLM